VGKVLDGMGRSRRPQGPSRASARTVPRATGPREENAGDGRPMRGGRQDAEGRGKARWELSGFEGPAMISACAACSGEVLSDDFTARAAEDGVRRLGKRVVGRYTLPGLCLLEFARWTLPCGRRDPRRSQKPDANPLRSLRSGLPWMEWAVALVWVDCGGEIARAGDAARSRSPLGQPWRANGREEFAGQECRTACRMVREMPEADVRRGRGRVEGPEKTIGSSPGLAHHPRGGQARGSRRTSQGAREGRIGDGGWDAHAPRLRERVTDCLL
jgi:hypothetical protein